MNHFITTHTGFHPIQLEDFAFIQQAYKEGFNALGRMMLPDGIEAAILTGCQLEIVGNDYSFTDGYVFYQGEIFAVAGDEGSFVDGQWPCLSFVVEYAQFNPVEYYDKTLKYVHQIRTMSFAFEDDTTGKVDFVGLRRASDILAEQYGLSATTGEELAQTTEDLRIAEEQIAITQEDLELAQDDIADLQDRVAVLEEQASPVGSIIMVDGDSIAYFDVVTGLGDDIYVNWALCDGQNGTPDLRGKFIAGYDPDQGPGGDYFIEAEGGEERVTLAEEEVPAHVHEYEKVTDDGTGTSLNSGGNDAYQKVATTTTESSVAGGVLVDEVNNVYETEAHENRPPYYVLAFIKRIA
ncbi:hypothetical protein Q0590_25135 [Rhodocytophaga aerolata]|uniref:Tail fiber protein n=1 Tax=Rhodocytophaga aerolata TaxID=455078 RepID=A0ABT8RBW6_9BACT|nr:hypothetical protein [Rhodocytophaga aerolata]MDO1449586.1 hypothetical protein [Rhodocytophaga aerolata]